MIRGTLIRLSETRWTYKVGRHFFTIRLTATVPSDTNPDALHYSFAVTGEVDGDERTEYATVYATSTEEAVATAIGAFGSASPTVTPRAARTGRWAASVNPNPSSIPKAQSYCAACGGTLVPVPGALRCRCALPALGAGTYCGNCGSQASACICPPPPTTYQGTPVHPRSTP
jgi:hypothetical protein